MRNTSSNTDLCEYSEKTGDGNLQPINSHELGLGTTWEAPTVHVQMQTQIQNYKYKIQSRIQVEIQIQIGRQKIQPIHTTWVWEPPVRCLLARRNTRNVDKMKRSYTIKLSTKGRYFSTALVHTVSCTVLKELNRCFGGTFCVC